jgi:hypothetical protein
LAWCFLFIVGIFLTSCSTPRPGAKSAFELLPPASNAQVSFRGVTQAGAERHSLEVRELAFYDAQEKRMVPSLEKYIVYVAGSYGSQILRKIDGSGFLVKKASNEIVEIYYTAGAHTDMRQRWKLIGYTAELQEEARIEWNERPRE